MKDFRVDHLKKTQGPKTLLEDVSFIINEGEHIGLIGKNGTGKSSLLNILSGMDSAEAGSIETSKEFRIGYLQQTPDLPEDATIFEALYQSNTPLLQLVHDYEEIVAELAFHPDDPIVAKKYEQLEQRMNNEDGWQAEIKIKSILQKVGITDVHQKISQLSGGQKKRVGLAKVLIEEPDLLLLDEPTNHLDVEAIEWLENYLKNYKGSLLLVTHDRYFLERVVNKMFDLVNGRIEIYEGNYQSYLEQRAKRSEIAQRMSEKQKRLYANELQWMRQGAKARTTKQQARIQRFEALEKEVKQKQDTNVLEINLDQQRIGKRVFVLEKVSLTIQQQVILQELDLIVQANARIGIVGDNGVGKSTFLNALAGEKMFDSGTFIVGDTIRMAYYKQMDDDIPMDKTVIQFLRQYAEEVKQKNGEVASVSELLETFLFPREMHGAQIGTLSGGERRRLYLLTLLITKPNVLLLDEPTNDLDIDTLTVLEQYIDEFNGAVLIVSHDRYFLDKTVDVLFDIQGNGKTQLFYGAMSEYLTQREKEIIVEKEVSVIKQAPKKRRLSYQEQKEWDTIEEVIETLEMQLTKLHEEMVEKAQDFVALQELQKQLTTIESTLEERYSRFEELSLLVEEMESSK